MIFGKSKTELPGADDALPGDTLADVGLSGDALSDVGLPDPVAAMAPADDMGGAFAAADAAEQSLGDLSDGLAPVSDLP